MNSPDNRPIGVFDSGVGGLSILRELQKRLPNENYVFFADQRNVPYGEKTKEQLLTFTDKIMQFLAGHDVKLVAAACNTATVHVLDELRAGASVPVVGVVPAIKLAAEHSSTHAIAMIATPATAQSDYVTGLIDQFAKQTAVARVGCFGLEDVVETGALKSERAASLLQKYVAPLKEKNIDQLVLGCTHYPFLKKQIAEIMGPGVALIDSGEAVARHVETLLRKENIVGASPAPSTKFFTNKDAADFSRVASLLLGQQVEGQYVSI